MQKLLKISTSKVIESIINLFKAKNTDLTTGSIRKQLITFAIPFLLSNFLQILYNVTDTFIIARFLGIDAIAASNNGGSIINVMTNIVIGLTVGGTIVIGQIRGAKESEKLESAIGTFFTIMTFIGLICSVLFIVFAKQLLVFLNTPVEVLDMAADFLRIYSLSIIFIFGYNSIASVFRGLGNSMITFVFVLCSVITNIVLDILFVVFLGFGIKGAAAATTISIVLSFVLSLIYLLRQPDVFKFKMSILVPDFTIARRILTIGVPSGIQSSIFGLSILVMTKFINNYGVIAGATIGIGSKIDSMFLLPIIAVSSASSAMIAQNYGARRFDRMKEVVLNTVLINFCFSMVFFTTAQFLPTFLFGLFTDNKEVIELGKQYMKFVSFNYIFLGFLQSFNALAIGVGNSFYALCTTIMNGFVFRVPIGYIFENLFNMGVSGLFIGLGFANLGGGIAGYIYYRIRFHRWGKLESK